MADATTMLGTKDAARYLGISLRYMRAQRLYGRVAGVRARDGTVWYSLAELDRWAARRAARRLPPSVVERGDPDGIAP